METTKEIKTVYTAGEKLIGVKIPFERLDVNRFRAITESGGMNKVHLPVLMNKSQNNPLSGVPL